MPFHRFLGVDQARAMTLSRIVVLFAFFMNGSLFATWVSRIPDIQERLALSEGALGAILMGMSIGVLTALSVSGSLIARFGSKRVSAISALGMCLSVPLIAIMPSPALLFIGLFTFGAAMSTMDVAMNAQAVRVEHLYKRPMMSSFHASFSVGGLFGALVGSGMERIDVPAIQHFVYASLFFFVGIILFKWLLEDEESDSPAGPVFQIPHPSLWPLGALAFCTALGEGAMADWSAVYLKNVIQTEASVAALGFAAFSLTMTAGRLVGDHLTSRYNPIHVIRYGGILATVGLVASILTSNYIIVLIGFGCVGFGLANSMPLAFSAAGRQPGIAPGAGIASVASIGYAGFLAGPPFIGLLAEQTSLRWSLFVIAILIATVIFTANAVKSKTAEHPEGAQP